jgi:hypothetical protein
MTVIHSVSLVVPSDRVRTPLSVSRFSQILPLFDDNLVFVFVENFAGVP